MLLLLQPQDYSPAHSWETAVQYPFLGPAKRHQPRPAPIRCSDKGPLVNAVMRSPAYTPYKHLICLLDDLPQFAGLTWVKVYLIIVHHMLPYRRVPLEVVSRQRLGNYLRAARESQRLTQETLAERAGFHPTYIAKIENGDRLPSLDAFFSLAKALHIPAADIMAALEEPQQVSPITDSILQEITTTLRSSSLVQLHFIRDFIRLMEFHSQ